MSICVYLQLGLVWDDPTRPECHNLLTIYQVATGKPKEIVAAEVV
jgi:tryptophanyl-tRNA synthetase